MGNHPTYTYCLRVLSALVHFEGILVCMLTYVLILTIQETLSRTMAGNHSWRNCGQQRFFLNIGNDTGYVFADEKDPVWKHKLVIWEIKGRILRIMSSKRQEGQNVEGLAVGRSSVLCNGSPFHYITGVHCNGREGKMQLHFLHRILLLIYLFVSPHTVSFLRAVRVNVLFIFWQKFLLFYFYSLIQCLAHSRCAINV